jgi:hypothetical protein
MSLEVIYLSPVNIEVAPPQICVTDVVHIDRIIDNPDEKTVSVRTRETGQLLLPSLSYENYNNPPWTDQMVIEATRQTLTYA